MKFSEILQYVNSEHGKGFLLVKKFTDGFRNAVFQIKDQKSHESFVLIVYKNEEDIEEIIKNAHDVAKFLGAQNFPVRLPIKSLNGEEILVFKKRYIVLYNFLTGSSIPWELYDRKHLKMMGKTLSNMHASLKDFPDGANLPQLKFLIKQEIDAMKIYFKKVGPWIKRKLNVSLSWSKIGEIFDFIENYSFENGSTLHFDFVRGNVLFSDNLLPDDTIEISGILDFEKVCTGPIVADVARTLSFLIVDCKFKEQSEVVKWFMDRGYVKRGNNKPDFPKNDLHMFIQYFWLRDFWKFLLHNPYEYLNQNEHYTRTTYKLSEYNLLKKL